MTLTLEPTILIRIQEMADDIRWMCDNNMERKKIVDNIECAEYLIHAYAGVEFKTPQIYMNEFYKRFFRQDGKSKK